MAQFDSLIEVGIVQNALEAQIRETLNKDYRLKLRVDGGNRNPLGVISRDLSQFEKSLQAAESRVLAFSATAGILYATTRAITDMVNSTLMFEQALTDINILLNLTDKQLSQFGTSLVSIARNTGQQFSEVAEVAKEFSRQGLGVAETLERTEAALVLVRNSSLSTTEAVSALTAAINSFSSEALTAAEVTNRYAAVDQKFATSSNDLAEAVARVGSTAVDAGLNLNQLLGIVTAVQQTTSRGGAVIGNALKTIFTRIGNNDSIAQLRDLGVNINNTQDGLQKLQAISEAVELNPQFANEIKRVAGGVYQINIVSAALKDLANTYGITQQAIETAENAQNTAFERNERQNKTLASTINATRQNLIALGATLGQGIFGPGIDRFFGRFNDIVKGFEDVSPDSFKGIGLKVGQGIINGLGEFIAGPGAAFASIIAAKLTLKFAKSAQEAFSFRNLFRDSGRDDTRDTQILTAQKAVNVLNKQPEILQQVINGTLTLQNAEQKVLDIIRKENAEREKQLQLIAKISAAVAVGSPVVPVSTINPPKGATKRNAYSGIVPSYAEATETMGALMGGYKPGKVKSKFIKGVGNIVYNDAEKIVNFPGMEQPAIMPPSSSKAGRNYKQKFEKVHGFDPYKAEGSIPNYAVAPRNEINKGNDGIFYQYKRRPNLGYKEFYDSDGPNDRMFIEKEYDNSVYANEILKDSRLIDAPQVIGSKKRSLARGGFGKSFVKEGSLEGINSIVSEETNTYATRNVLEAIARAGYGEAYEKGLSVEDRHLDNIGSHGGLREFIKKLHREKRLESFMKEPLSKIKEELIKNGVKLSLLDVGRAYKPAKIGPYANEGLIPNFALSPRTILSSDKEGGSLNYNVDTDFGEAIISMISSYGKAGTSKELYPILRSELEKEGIKKVSGYLNAQGLKPRSNSWKDKLTAQFPQLVRGRSFNKNRLLVDDTAFDLAGGDKFDADLEKKASFILNAISKGEGSVKLESFLSNGLIPNFVNPFGAMKFLAKSSKTLGSAFSFKDLAGFAMGRVSPEQLLEPVKALVKNPSNFIKSREDLEMASEVIRTVLSNDFAREKFARFGAANISDTSYSNNPEDLFESLNSMDQRVNEFTKYKLFGGSLDAKEYNDSDKYAGSYTLSLLDQIRQNKDNSYRLIPTKKTEQSEYNSVKDAINNLLESRAYSPNESLDGNINQTDLDINRNFLAKNYLLGRFTGKLNKSGTRASYYDRWDVELNNSEKSVLQEILKQKEKEEKFLNSANNFFGAYGGKDSSLILRHLVSQIPKAEPVIFRGVVSGLRGLPKGFPRAKNTDDEIPFINAGLIPNFANFDFLNRGSFAEVFRINKGLVGKVFNPEEGFRRTMSEPKLLQMFNKTRDGLIMARNIALSKDLPVKVARTYKPGDFSQFDMYRKDTDAFIKEFGPNVFFQEFIQDKGKSLSKEERARQAYILNKAASKGPNSNPPFGDLIDNPGNFVGDTIIDLLMYGNANQGLVPNYSKLVDYSPALKEAIAREREAGVPPSLIKIGKDSRIKSKQNPFGLGVYNSKDEPMGLKQGIVRAQRQGVDPKIYGTNNTSSGLVPNFASNNLGNLDFLKKELEAFKSAIKFGAVEMKDLGKFIDNLSKTFNLTDKDLKQIRKNLTQSFNYKENQQRKAQEAKDLAKTTSENIFRGTIKYQELQQEESIPEPQGKSNLPSSQQLISKRLGIKSRKTPLKNSLSIVEESQRKLDSLLSVGEEFSRSEQTRATISEIDKKLSKDIEDIYNQKSRELKARYSTSYSDTRKSRVEDARNFPENPLVPRAPNTPSRPKVDLFNRVDLRDLNSSNRSNQYLERSGRMGPYIPPISFAPETFSKSGFAASTTKNFYEQVGGAPNRAGISRQLESRASRFAQNGLGISLVAPIASEIGQSLIGDDTLNKRRAGSVLSGVANTASFAGTGALIGSSLGGPAGALPGLALGTTVGLVTSVSDAIKEWNNNLPELENQLLSLSRASESSTAGFKEYLDATERLNAILKGEIGASPEQIDQLKKSQSEGFSRANFSKEQIANIEKSGFDLKTVLDERSKSVRQENAQQSALSGITALNKFSLDPSKFLKGTGFFDVTEKVDFKNPGARSEIVGSIQNILKSSKDGKTLGQFLQSDEFKQSELGKGFENDTTGRRSFDVLRQVAKDLNLKEVSDGLESLSDRFSGTLNSGKELNFIGSLIKEQVNNRKQAESITDKSFKSTERSIQRSEVLTDILENISRSFNSAIQQNVLNNEIRLRTNEGQAEIGKTQREINFGLSSTFLSDIEKNSLKLNNALLDLTDSFRIAREKNENDALNSARSTLQQSSGNLVESISRIANQSNVDANTRERLLDQATIVSSAIRADLNKLQGAGDIGQSTSQFQALANITQQRLNDQNIGTTERESLKAQLKIYNDIVAKLQDINVSYTKQNSSLQITAKTAEDIARLQKEGADRAVTQRNNLSFLGGLGGGVRVEAAQNQLFELNNDLDIAQQTDDLNSIQLILNRIAETYKNISVDLPESIRKQLVSVEEASIISLQKRGLFDQTVNPRQAAEERVQSQFPERQFNSLPNDRGLQGPPTIPAEFTDRLKQQSNLFTSIEEKNKAIAEIEQIRKRLNQDIANNGLDILQASNQLQQSTQAILALQRQFPDNTVILKSAVDSIRQQEELFSSVAERETFLFDLETKRVDIQKKINLGIIDGVKGQRQYNQEVTESVALQTELAFQANRVGGEAVKAASNANRLAKLNRDGSLSSNDFGQAFTDGFKYNTFDMYKDLNQYATDFGDTFKDAVKGAFAEFQNGTKSAKEALVDLGLSIARNIGNKAFDIGLNNILGATLGNLKFSNGGQVKGYSTGGVVTGGSGVKDDVPAMLTDGEYVVKRAAVKEYGTDFLDQVNQKKVFYDGETTAVSNSDRSFDAVFKNTLQLDDPKNPTKGTLLFDENLSSFAFEDENNPQNERRNRREDLLGSYIRRNKQIMDEYKKRKNNQLNAALIQAGVSLAGIGIGQLAGSMGSSSGSVSGATGNTVSSSPYSAGVGYNNTSIGGGFNISPSAPASSLGLSSYDNLKYSQFSGASSFYSGLRYNRGGKVKKYANGGNVFGGDSYSDRIPALLTDGEYVITKDAVRFYGTDFFNELNSGKINKYALGGQVGPSYPSPVMAQVSDLTPTIEDLNSSIEDLRRAIEDISGGTTDVSSSRAITPANNGANTAQPQFSISIPITIYNNGENGGTSVSGESRVTSNNTQENNNQNSGSRDKARTDAENAKALGERMLAVAKRAIIEEMRPNGLLENVNKR